jgi:hypothetical protein
MCQHVSCRALSQYTGYYYVMHICAEAFLFNLQQASKQALPHPGLIVGGKMCYSQ